MWHGTMVHDIVERYLLANKFYFQKIHQKVNLNKKVIDGYNALDIDEGEPF
jgi:hypothetical protein